MELRQAKRGKTYIVERLNLDIVVERRLQALGLTLGTMIEVLNTNKGGAVIFKVRGTRLAIGKQFAQAIMVREDI